MVEAIPNFGDVICSRDGDGIHTNVPHRIIWHSPDGFEWGYGGSGPAEFALNILSVFVGEKEAKILHQDFKWEFISGLPEEGGTIRREDIMRWVEEKRESNNGLL